MNEGLARGILPIRGEPWPLYPMLLTYQGPQISLLIGDFSELVERLSVCHSRLGDVLRRPGPTRLGQTPVNTGKRFFALPLEAFQLGHRCRDVPPQCVNVLPPLDGGDLRGSSASAEWPLRVAESVTPRCNGLLLGGRGTPQRGWRWARPSPQGTHSIFQFLVCGDRAVRFELIQPILQFLFSWQRFFSLLFIHFRKLMGRHIRKIQFLLPRFRNLLRRYIWKNQVIPRFLRRSPWLSIGMRWLRR